MARPLVTDELWELVEPLIPKVTAYGIGSRVGSGSTIARC